MTGLLEKWFEVRGYLAFELPCRNLGRVSPKEWTGRQEGHLKGHSDAQRQQSIKESLGCQILSFRACSEQCPKLVKPTCRICEFPQQDPCPECPKSFKRWFQVIGVLHETRDLGFSISLNINN
ncbi:hypothetical protein PIB30_047663 [Stylosanthes scabra]|uniref:Uncharacterized protein n=1 Tax=Stylosanthes scabra TaxID=79078 RepID=A0ABU6WGJ0_9FABA|nr:hypothetical protein [Stylosanthes scabra]